MNKQPLPNVSIRMQFRAACVLLCGITTIAVLSVTPPVEKNTAAPQKSSAQVESLVRPQVVSPNSCELKLGRLRPYRLMGRFSKEEKEAVEVKAGAERLSINEYIRAVTLGPDSYKPPLDPELARVLFGLKRELTMQGNNLNQIAKHLNGATATAPQGESMVAMLGRSLLKTHQMIRNALNQNNQGPMP